MCANYIFHYFTSKVERTTAFLFISEFFHRMSIYSNLVNLIFINIPSEQSQYILTIICEQLFINEVNMDLFSPNLFNLMFYNISLYITKSNNILKGYIVKPLPLQMLYLSSPSPYPDTHTLISSSNPLDLLSDNSNNSDELLLAESLINTIIQYIPFKIVKFSGHGNGFGFNEYIAPDCLETGS